MTDQCSIYLALSNGEISSMEAEQRLMMCDGLTHQEARLLVDVWLDDDDQLRFEYETGSKS